MKKIVASGKTIEEAVRNGLLLLEVSREEVDVTVLKQPSKGLFGLIGAKDAQVELAVVQQPEQQGQDTEPEAAAEPAPASAPAAAQEEEGAPQPARAVDNDAQAADALEKTGRFLREVADAMGLNVQIERQDTREGHTLAISGAGDIGMLIGRRGQTLDALQYLANIIANRHSDSYIRIVLDAEDFRERRRKTLEELSERLANRVVRSRKEVVLEPMSPQERKIIHSHLQHHEKVKTYSKGDEPNRRVVIGLK